uniref:PH domain-containing protein n=1 Tax=Heterorhabditis bacteriophora TaxID=37862 RepID=A0A1I7XNC6_HETBA
MAIDKPTPITKIDKKKVAPTSALPKEPKEKKGILRSLSFQFSNLGRKKDNHYDLTPEETSYEDLGPVLGVQCNGTLLKKYKKKNRPAKWSKRFFILKECFLIYYSTRFKKTFEKTRRIDLHPKGIIPLIGCSIVSGGDVGKKHCLLIAHPQFPSAIIVAAPDFKIQELWLKALRNATKINYKGTYSSSYKNTIVGESMIRELENRGVMLKEEKKTYEERLEQEAKARQEEQDKAVELTKLKEELEEERKRLIQTTKKLKDDLQNVKNELKVTNEMKKTLEQEKLSLNSKTEYLQANMESLNIEKEKIQEQLHAILREREQFLLENQNLSTATCQLKNRLMEIETKTNCIMTEKEKIENLLRLNEHKTLDLEKERQYYTNQTKELILNLKYSKHLFPQEVSEQKELTETELREQMLARIGAEKQLQAAERALEHLEMALKMTGAQMTELQEHIMPDVHKLREFFEQCAEEAKLEANRTGIMRQAIYARKSIRRSKRNTRSSFRRQLSFREKEDKRDDERKDVNDNNTLMKL